MDYQVVSGAGGVTAWSRARPVFEPMGWQREFREELRAALRALPAEPGKVLAGEYGAPASSYSAYVDVENVLFHNVGSGAYSHLCAAGLAGRRVRSPDELHRLHYRLVARPGLGDAADSVVLGEVDARLGERVPATAGVWWARLRPAATAARPVVVTRDFELDVRVAGPAVRGPRIAGMAKSLLDGLVCAFHPHNGSAAGALRDRLGDLGAYPAVWDLLCDRSQDVLGNRTLVRPYGRTGLYWNPADERCAGFRITASVAPEWSVRAQLRVSA